MPYKAVTELGNVDQSVLMNPDVHKGPEVDHVAHGAGEDHAGLQILHLQDIRTEDGFGQFVPGVTAGLHQFAHDVLQCRQADAAVLRRPRFATLLQLLWQLADPAGLYVCNGVAAEGQQLLGSGVALRVDCGIVQHGLALRYSQEAGALLKRLRPKLGHLQQLLAGAERTIGLTVGYNVLRRRSRQAADPAQERRGSGVQVHAHGVDAVFHHSVQALFQPFLRHIVLILPHADGLGLDLHQFRQRVLQAPGDGNGGAQIYVVLRELLSCQLACTVDAGSCFAHHHVADAGASVQQIHGHLLRLPGGGAVAYGNMLDAMLFDHGGKGVDAGCTLLFAVGRIDHRGIQYFPCGVHHCHLAAHPVAGVQPHGHLALHRRSHEKGFQIQREIVDSPLGGSVCQRSTGLGLHARLQKPVIAVSDGRTQEGFIFCSRTHHALGDLIQSQFPIQGKGNLQKSFLLAPVDGQDLMPLQAGYRLGEVIVQAINAVLFLYRLCAQTSAPLDSLPELLPVLGTVADLFGYDVRSTGQSVFDRADAFFFVEVG